MTVTGATLFSGFEGVGCGMKAAGIKHAWGIEYDPDIGAVAQRNGFDVTIADILECDPFDFEPVDVLHASPPCPNFSVAKAGGKETEQDIALGRKVAEFADVLRPSLFTLENVYGYRKAESFRHIVKALRDIGYKVRWWHLNSADYGVPQTRKRLIMAAALDFIPQRPEATHAPVEDISPLFDTRKPWVGWYEAIEDLIPELPDSEFAPWQLERLPDELREMLVNTHKGAKRGKHYRVNEEPSETINASKPPKAFVVNTKDFDRHRAGAKVRYRNGKEPAATAQSTMTAQRFRAFVMWSNGNLDSWGRHHVEEAEPALTVSPQTNGRARAFDINGENAGNEWGKLRRDDDEPHYSLSGNNSVSRAFVVKGGDKWANIPNGDEPSYTIPASSNGIGKAAIAGRVVQMTPRALARFQSFPDWYTLPDSKTLACRGIGNAVPPLLYRRIVEGLL